IKVCKRWRESFEVFLADILADIGPRPSSRPSIDRIDTNGFYERGNVRCATKKEQAANRRSTVWVMLHGARISLKEAVAVLNLPYSRVEMRRRAGWTDEEALGLAERKRRNLTRKYIWVDMPNGRMPLQRAAAH